MNDLTIQFNEDLTANAVLSEEVISMTINTEHIGLKYDAFRDDASLLACHVKNDVEALVAEVERVREMARVADRKAYRAEQLLQQERQPSRICTNEEKLAFLSPEDRRMLRIPGDAFEAISWSDLPNARKIVDPPMVNELNWRDGQMFDDKGRPLVTLLRTRYQDLAYAAETLLKQRDQQSDRATRAEKLAADAEREVRFLSGVRDNVDEHNRVVGALRKTEEDFSAACAELSVLRPEIDRVAKQRDDLRAQLVAMARTADQWQKDAEIEHKEVVKLQGRADFLADELAETEDSLRFMNESADRWMAKSEENLQATRGAMADLDLKRSEVTRLVVNVTEARQEVAKWKKRAKRLSCRLADSE